VNDHPHQADRIELRGMRAMGTHGLLLEERTRAQPFEVDLDLDLDLRVAGRTDRLTDTADYAGVGAAALAVITGPHVDLLERLAELIARAAVAAVTATGLAAGEVSVTVRKLRPPVPFEIDSVGVTIHRTASELASSPGSRPDRVADVRSGPHSHPGAAELDSPASTIAGGGW
jgi:dihydroneopterin aldolase / 2-amino-4-hydroxy-6-hydroxymethyldihydropteridine diphosphokinase